MGVILSREKWKTKKRAANQHQISCEAQKDGNRSLRHMQKANHVTGIHLQTFDKPLMCNLQKAWMREKLQQEKRNRSRVER